jgi:hypothetical protein
MTVPHPPHPKCPECGKALYKRADPGPVKKEDPWAFCRNPKCLFGKSPSPELARIKADFLGTSIVDPAKVAREARAFAKPREPEMAKSLAPVDVVLHVERKPKNEAKLEVRIVKAKPTTSAPLAFKVPLAVETLPDKEVRLRASARREIEGALATGLDSGVHLAHLVLGVYQSKAGAAAAESLVEEMGLAEKLGLEKKSAP